MALRGETGHDGMKSSCLCYCSNHYICLSYSELVSFPTFSRNNFLRLCVLKVTQQSEKHLEKILNVDEFVKRVFSVIHSNDPVARAITLRYCVSV